MDIKMNTVEGSASNDIPDDLPPPYEDLSRPPSSILTDITNTTISGPMEPIPGRPFPLAFNLYYAKGTPITKTSRFLLGEHFDQPRNAAILAEGHKDTTQLNIHDGLDAKSPILATVRFEKGWNNEKTITLPGHFTSSGTPMSQTIKSHAGFKHFYSSFSIPVSNADSKPRTEKFEWRMSHGKEVEDLNQKTWGFKLVRLGSDDETAASSSSASKSEGKDYGLASDGKEVVAVWAANSRFSTNKLSSFQFLGSGARGELGEAWAIMAVATMVTLGAGINKKLMFGSGSS